VAGAIALLAGATPGRAALLSAAMLLLQLGIGAANDWADAADDARVKPAKPIAAGLVPRPAAAVVAAAAAATGLLLAGLAGVGALVLALLGLGTGLAYDFRLKGSRWSWLPYAVGIPTLLLFGWVGAGGRLTAAFLVVVPVAALAGAALAVANSLADVERDFEAGVETVATTLGIAQARRVGAALQGLVLAAALGSAAALGGAPAGIGLAGLGGAIVLVGVRGGWDDRPEARRRAWELQAIGLGVVAAGWVGSLVAAGRLAG
jgi:4-hydroxybenzoate polyprenyltransferase